MATSLMGWAKSITFGLFMILLFYFYYDNIFANMIGFIGDFEISGVTDAGSIAILKTFAWISFAILFITTIPLYMFYGVLQGSKGADDTNPIEILKGVAIWLISLPIGIVLYVIVAVMVSSLTTATTGLMDDPNNLASQFSWLIGLFCIMGVSVLPFYYILKGYGQLGVEDVT